MAELQFTFANTVVQTELDSRELAALLAVMADRYAKGQGFFLTIPVAAEDRMNVDLEQYWLPASTQVRALFGYRDIGTAVPGRATELLTALDIYPELLLNIDTGLFNGRADVLGDEL